MTYETILYEKQGPVAIITLNRPDRLNAYTRQMQQEMLAAITASNNDPEVGAMIFTGAGRAFCAGADIEQMFKANMDEADAGAKKNKSEVPPWVDAVRRAKPMIAAVNGVAVGVGVTLILPFDYIIASHKARFCCAFAKMGVVTELASSHYLVQRMGFGRASEAALSARMIGAEEAVQSGLADRLAPPEELLHAALEVANSMAANPDSSLRAIKELLTQNGAEADLTLVQEREMAALDAAYASPAHKEAVDAFLEKRPANFQR